MVLSEIRHCEATKWLWQSRLSMRDLIRILNLFNILIYSTRLPRRDYAPPRNDVLVST
ncbi:MULTISPECIES: hypothetical protein [unclassified Rickettsia]|uniref:hypothetical protein n=1 Tax=unclassified Rickettsia TaxID=114295 RepID=UPI003132B827